MSVTVINVTNVITSSSVSVLSAAERTYSWVWCCELVTVWLVIGLYWCACAWCLQLTAEDEERRRIRRERNKLAAARCRQRRVDLTNQLLAVSLIRTSSWCGISDVIVLALDRARVDAWFQFFF